MAFIDKLEAMSQAKVTADQAFVASLIESRDAYVLAVSEHRDVERRWLDNPADDTLRRAAQDRWKELVAARKTLTDAITAADAAREASLAGQWDQIRLAV